MSFTKYYWKRTAMLQLWLALMLGWGVYDFFYGHNWKAYWLAVTVIILVLFEYIIYKDVQKEYAAKNKVKDEQGA